MSSFTPAVAADKPPPNWRRIAPKGENSAPESNYNSSSGKQLTPPSPLRGSALSSPNQKAVRQGAETIKAGWVGGPVGLTAAAVKTLEPNAGFEANADFTCATPRSENGTTATSTPAPVQAHFVKPRPSPTTPGHRRNATWAPGSTQVSSGPLSEDPFAMLAVSRAISSPTEHRTVGGEESLISFEDASGSKKDIYRAVTTQDGVSALVKTPLGGIAEGYEVVLLDGALEGAAAGSASAPPPGGPYLVPYPSGGYVMQPASGPLQPAYSEYPGAVYAQQQPVQYVYGYGPGGVAVPTPLYMAPPAAYPTAAQAVGLHATQESTPSPFEAGQASSSGSHDRLDAAEELLQRLSMRTSPYDEGRLAADPNAFADLLPDQIVNVKQAQFVKEVLAAAPSQDIQTVSPEDSATSLTHFVPKDDDAAFSGLVQERLSGFTSGRGGASMNASGSPSKLQDPFGGSAVW